MTSLILKRAAASRPSGQWSEDDYDVLEDGVVVGRIFVSTGAPKNRPWVWSSGQTATSNARRTVTNRRGRPRWLRSRRAGEGSRLALPLARPVGTKTALFFGFRLRSPFYVANFTFAVPPRA
jgi:hypothetical protein